MAIQFPPKLNRRPPAYRQRKGYTQAIVTLTDAVTKRRKDYWLGEYGSPESRELYYRVLAEYEALGRRVVAAVDRAKRKAPSRGGALVRRSARMSIRKREGPAPSGRPRRLVSPRHGAHVLGRAATMPVHAAG